MCYMKNMTVCQTTSYVNVTGHNTVIPAVLKHLTADVNSHQ